MYNVYQNQRALKRGRASVHTKSPPTNLRLFAGLLAEQTSLELCECLATYYLIEENDTNETQEALKDRVPFFDS